jgi:quercetin dioxygenase-like cupin family protein
MAAKPLFNGESVQSGDLAGLGPIVDGAIVSKTLIDTGALKQILFAMDAGQEISDHKAPYVATVHVLDGSLRFTVDDQELDMPAGQWLVMPPHAPHALRAESPCLFLLTLVKG